MGTTNGADRRQPETITVVQVLLVLTAVVGVLGLLVAVALVGALMTLAEQLGALGGGAGGLGTAVGSGLAAEMSGRATAGLVLGTLDAVLAVGAAIWAFGAVARGLPLARLVLSVAAGAQAVLTIAAGASLGLGASAVVLGVVAGLLVFDAPVLLLLWIPAASRQWFLGDDRAAGGAASAATDRTPPIPARAALRTPDLRAAEPVAVPVARGPVSGPVPVTGAVMRPADEDPPTVGLVLPRQTSREDAAEEAEPTTTTLGPVPSGRGRHAVEEPAT